jgi:hypothetical protein
MHQLFTEFLMDTLRQLCGWAKPRQGRIILTHHAFVKMREYQLDPHTLEDTFRFGEEIAEEKIIRTYDRYSVGLIYKFDDTQLLKSTKQETRFVIITCWKGVRNG